MRIIIAGGRELTDYEYVRQAMIFSGYWREFKHSIEVVSGMALSWKWASDPLAGGVDRQGVEFAKRNGLEVHEFHADWKTHGKAAGHIRNREMGDFAKAQEGRLLAVWDGLSVGTRGMIEYARSIDLKGYVYRTDKAARYVKAGAKLKTNFSGKWTWHTVVDVQRDYGWNYSQSGVRFLLDPPVPKSSEGREPAWIDSDWFRLD